MLWLKFELIKICGFVLFILWIYLLSVVEGKHVTKRGFMDNINNGIKYAGQMMGINTAADVATLVAKAFSSEQVPPKQFDSSFLFQTPSKHQSSERDTDPSIMNPTDMIGGLLRMIGFDAGKLGALAINALLMIAQLIGNTFKKRKNSANFPKSSEDGRYNDDEESSYDDQQNERSSRSDDTPLDWILTNPPEGLSDFMKQIIDGKLPDKLVEAIGRLETQNGQGDCIKLLMCKSAPFIWGMQKSVSNRLNGELNEAFTEKFKIQEPMSMLFQNLPEIEEYRRHDHLCEQRYSQFCNRNYS
ncbi:uncharacterized protein LOC129920300 [Episyrphus balteatus]|uniref:uncharacterized protein LOC129920300 n=1 Tax=Episyrphus balteatus TaxID=286459 RepID=UPI0024860931|nr:uncharacterized protein LOC129920300 [Episyrphus balteatus]XP_055857621.1 uncharacterized protein LOC129920300 [Episyrphus balteatus]